MPRRTTRLLLLTTAAIAPLGVAQAASTPRIAVWTGKTSARKALVQASRTGTSAKVFVDVQVTCTEPTGKQPFALQGVGKVSRSGSLQLSTSKALNNKDGKLSVSGSFVRGRSAKGKVSWSIPGGTGTCTGNDRFTLKYQVGHPG